MGHPLDKFTDELERKLITAVRSDAALRDITEMSESWEAILSIRKLINRITSKQRFTAIEALVISRLVRKVAEDLTEGSTL